MFPKSIIGFLLALVLIISFLLRVVNLNYNSPFNDEAVYIVIGKMGVFERDWFSYGAKQWMAGFPYFYPTLTALSYVTGGIVGSRFLSVMFGIMSIEAVYVISSLMAKDDGRKYVSGLVAAAVLGGASVSLYVSRLATYDIPSFSFFFLGLAALVWALKTQNANGKWFFISSSFLFFSFLAKIITGIYIPILVVYSFWKVRKNKVAYEFWKKYFFLPLALFLAIYMIFNLSSLRMYVLSQGKRERSGPLEVIREFWNDTTYVWIWWIIGSLGMFMAKGHKKWLLLTFMSLCIPVFHIITKTVWWTLAKHTFISVAFLAIIAGIGISNIIWYFEGKESRKLTSGILVLGIILFWVFSYIDLQGYNHLWSNANKMLAVLPNFVNRGDKVLVEVGAPAILALYDKNYPHNITTFDWFEYRSLSGAPAYIEAIKDGYFDVVEIEGDAELKDEMHEKVSDAVWENIEENYNLVYSEGNYYVYKRKY